MKEVIDSKIEWAAYYDKLNNLVAIPDGQGKYKQYNPTII
jgi:hypothetical protein